MASKKRKAAKSGFKAGKRKAARTPAGTAVFTAKALAGNQQARAELRDAYASARKAYKRSADRSGRPNIVTLLDDRKAKKEAGNALTSLRHALKIAEKRRQKPRGGKGPAVLVLTAAGAGAGALIYKQRSSSEETAATTTNGAAATA
ncbi:MAG TPA: hypothetical protein VFY44_12690 [Thermoleophilaceae bacterium]|nr:hypothetical protein [Thermoleophilaceae bacterium]